VVSRGVGVGWVASNHTWSKWPMANTQMAGCKAYPNLWVRCIMPNPLPLVPCWYACCHPLVLCGRYCGCEYRSTGAASFGGHECRKGCLLAAQTYRTAAVVRAPICTSTRLLASAVSGARGVPTKYQYEKEDTLPLQLAGGGVRNSIGSLWSRA
jgi:hypothetical protein